MPPKQAAGKPKPAKAKKTEVEAEDPNRVQAPDKATHEKALEAVQTEIDVLIEEQKKLNAEIADQSAGKEEFMQRKSELFAQLMAFKEKIDDIMGRKQDINKDMSSRKAEATEEKNQLKKMKNSLRYEDEAQIDERINDIEIKIQTETMSLKDEKNYLKEISELKKSKPQIAKVRQFEEGTKGRTDRSGDLKAQIGDINLELDAYRKGKQQVQQQLTELLDSRKQEFEGLTKQYDERNKLRDRITEKKGERDQLRSEFREKEKEFNQYLKQQREDRYKKSMEERVQWKQAFDLDKRKQAAAKLEDNPDQDTITLIEQTVAFCKSLVAVKDVKGIEEKKEIEHDLPDGAQVLTKKEDREEFYFVPTAAKKKGKSKNKAAKSEGAKPIKHNAATFALFDKLHLNAPITTDDIPGALEKLEAQLEEYKEKTKHWEENREEMKRKILAGEAEEEPAAEAKEDVAAAAEEN